MSLGLSSVSSHLFTHPSFNHILMYTHVLADLFIFCQGLANNQTFFSLRPFIDFFYQNNCLNIWHTRLIKISFSSNVPSPLPLMSPSFVQVGLSEKSIGFCTQELR